MELKCKNYNLLDLFYTGSRTDSLKYSAVKKTISLKNIHNCKQYQLIGPSYRKNAVNTPQDIID